MVFRGFWGGVEGGFKTRVPHVKKVKGLPEQVPKRKARFRRVGVSRLRPKIGLGESETRAVATVAVGLDTSRWLQSENQKYG